MKNSDIRTLLRLTQQDMAMFLGVSRSHYSMFESGKRALPMVAMQRYAELVSQASTAQAKPKATPAKKIKEMHTARQQILKRLLQENEYQQLLIAKQISRIVRKQQYSEQRSLVLNRLKDTGFGTDESANEPAILKKAAAGKDDNDIAALLKLEIRQEVLAFEKSLVEFRLLQKG